MVLSQPLLPHLCCRSHVSLHQYVLVVPHSRSNSAGIYIDPRRTLRFVDLAQLANDDVVLERR